MNRACVTYARVSSKEQEREGFSIDAQKRLFRGYAEARQLNIAREFIDIETAKESGREAFSEMVKFMREQGPSCRVLLVEKTDRLYRNFRDYVTIDDLDIEVHFVKEGNVLARESRSAAKLEHGLRVLIAKNYIDNLSEEARKGMQEKAEQGIWPAKAPLGYRNIVGPNGKKIIEPDPSVAPLITRIFEDYVTGTRSVKEVTQLAQANGLVFRRTKARVPVATVHKMLRSRIYTGEFEWKGKVHQGTHEALVSRELWNRVQAILDRRQANKHRKMKHDFAFSHLITCGHCGCSLVGEIKKGKYVYYRCSGYKGKCPEPYVREEELEARFTEVLKGLHFDAEVLQLVTNALRSSHADQRRFHAEAIARSQAEYTKLQNRIEQMYLDKLDGKVDAAFFEKKQAEWRTAQLEAKANIDDHEHANQSYLDQGVMLLELASRSHELFAAQAPREKRRLLDFVLQNCTWKGGLLTPTYRQPFDMIAESSVASRNAKAAGVTPDGQFARMLGN